jgi:sugar/nucleoside kinase (ribokinase family)
MIHVFGAVLVDVIACRDHFTPSTSSIAPITIRLGGVGYNIFRALDPAARRLVTAVGDGPFSQHVRRALGELSTQVLLHTVPGSDVGIYVAFMERGRLLYGAADAAAFETAMTGAWLDGALEAVAPGDIVVVDANLPADSLAHLVRALHERGAWLVFETVSVDKSARAREGVRDLFLATPTEDELASLMGVSAPTLADISAWMAERRIEHVVVTLGRQGLRWLHAGESRLLEPTRALEVSDTTGAGDTLLGALLAGLHAWLAARELRLPDAAARRAAAGVMPGILRRAMDEVERYLEALPTSGEAVDGR